MKDGDIYYDAEDDDEVGNAAYTLCKALYHSHTEKKYQCVEDQASIKASLMENEIIFYFFDSRWERGLANNNKEC